MPRTIDAKIVYLRTLQPVLTGERRLWTTSFPIAQVSRLVATGLWAAGWRARPLKYGLTMVPDGGRYWVRTSGLFRVSAGWPTGGTRRPDWIRTEKVGLVRPRPS